MFLAPARITEMQPKVIVCPQPYRFVQYFTGCKSTSQRRSALQTFWLAISRLVAGPSDDLFFVDLRCAERGLPQPKRPCKQSITCFCVVGAASPISKINTLTSKVKLCRATDKELYGKIRLSAQPVSANHYPEFRCLYGQNAKPV